jgi:peptide/nickel transport system permease protein
MRGLKWKLAGNALSLLVTVLLGGMLSATLVRLAPGFNADERELDPHLSAESVQALRNARHQDGNIFHFYFSYMQRAASGDLGTSLALGQPVRTLLRERIPLTLRLLTMGLALAWILTIALSLSAAWLRLSIFDTVTTAVSGALLCIPAAVLALLSVLWSVPGSLAIALIVFPRSYRYARNLFWHVVPVVAPQLLAVAGVSVSVAVGAAIPVEALCGLPGIGQLAWQAALARDLPLLVNITIMVTLVTLLANSGADVIGSMVRGSETRQEA